MSENNVLKNRYMLINPPDEWKEPSSTPSSTPTSTPISTPTSTPISTRFVAHEKSSNQGIDRNYR